MSQWSSILGHQRILDVFEQAIDSGRMHHAYLLTGPPGIGKFTVAHAMAAVLNCTSRPDSFAPDCGQCSTCRRIEKLQHPDVLLVDPPKRQIVIDQIRDVQKACVSAPYEGRYRVVLINEAHAMTEEAANALLKTLEEPPDRTMLFVVTDQPHRLLETIISRCQRMRFGALDEQLVADALPRFLNSDDDDDDPPQFDQRLLNIAAGYGEGSLGRSLAMLESGMLEDREEFLSELFDVDPRSSVDWLDVAEKLGDSTEHLEQRIDVLTVFFRDLMLFKRAEPDRIVNADLRELIERRADDFSLDAIIATLEALMSARYRLRGHVSAQLLAEDLVDRLRRPNDRALDPPA